MRRGMSIRLRLTLLYTAILALTVIAFSSILYATQSQSTYAGIKANLVRQAAFFPNAGKPDPAPSSLDRKTTATPPADAAGMALPSGTLPGRWTQTRSMDGEVTGQTLDLSGVTLPLSAKGLAAVQAGEAGSRPPRCKMSRCSSTASSPPAPTTPPGSCRWPSPSASRSST